MSDLTLTLHSDEVAALMGVLGDLPTKTNAWPLLIKIKDQVARAELAATDPEDDLPVATEE